MALQLQLQLHPSFRITSNKKSSPSSSHSRKFSCFCLVNSLGLDDVAAIAHNKVLIAAGVSAAIGQLSKPFTSQLFYNSKHLDFKSAFQAGGFPSTHSSAVVATATSLALERGLSDSIFGLSFVYASLVMYDAQGVRREVGNHAKLLNKTLPTLHVKSMIIGKDRNDTISSQQEASALSLKDGKPLMPNSTNASLLLDSESKSTQPSQLLVSSVAEEGAERSPNSSASLKESIGHSEVEVIAGALLGFFVGMAVYTVM